MFVHTGASYVFVLLICCYFIHILLLIAVNLFFVGGGSLYPCSTGIVKSANTIFEAK